MALTPRQPSAPRDLTAVTRRAWNLEHRSCGPWIYPSIDPDYTYLGAWGDIGSRKKSRYRWLLGGGVEIQLLATGGAPGTGIFALRPGYWDAEIDPEGSAHDETGVYRPWYLDGTTGIVTDGVGP